MRVLVSLSSYLSNLLDEPALLVVLILTFGSGAISSFLVKAILVALKEFLSDRGKHKRAVKDRVESDFRSEISEPISSWRKSIEMQIVRLRRAESFDYQHEVLDPARVALFRLDTSTGANLLVRVEEIDTVLLGLAQEHAAGGAPLGWSDLSAAKKELLGPELKLLLRRVDFWVHAYLQGTLSGSKFYLAKRIKVQFLERVIWRLQDRLN